MYKISIIKIQTVPYERKEWQRVADTGNPRDGGPAYDYAKYDSTVKEETKILEQELEEIDLKAVIKAVNGL